MQAIHYYFIHHGETEANRDHIIQGWTDSPLTEEGQAQMQHLANVFADIPIALAFTSDLGRSVTSSKILLSSQKKALTAVPLKDFREYNFGGLENQQEEKVFEKSIKTLVEEMQHHHIPESEYLPNIFAYINNQDRTEENETFIQFWTRIEDAMLEVHDDALEYRLDHMKPEINVAIVTHSIPVCAFLHEVLPEFDLTETLDYGHYAKVTYSNGLYELEKWNVRS